MWPGGAGRGLAGSRRDRARGGCPWTWILVVPFLSVVGGARAANWDIEPRLRVAGSYTDNVGLAPSDEQSDYIAEVTPAIRLRGDGNRADVELAYRANSVIHREDSDRNRTYHRGAAEGTAELVRRHLFVDADVARVEGITASDSLVPDSDIFGSRDRDDVTTWGVGPRFVYGLGSFARLQARHRRSGTESDDRADSVTDSSFVGLSSGPVFNDWGWALSYERREQEEESVGPARLDEDRTFETARGELSLRAGAHTVLFAAGGTEDNEFETATGEAVDGDFWEAGLRWNPSRTVSMEASAGERFFGETGSFRLDVQGAVVSLRATYQETLTTRPEIESERASFLVRDEDGNIVLGPGGEPVTVAVSIPTVRDEVILEDRATIGLVWEHGYSRVSLDLIATEREFLESRTNESSEGVNLGYQWDRLTRTTVEAELGFTRLEVAPTEREDEFATARLGAVRDLDEDLDLSLDIEHSERDSTVPAREFDVNRVTLALEKVF